MDRNNIEHPNKTIRFTLALIPFALAGIVHASTDKNSLVNRDSPPPPFLLAKNFNEDVDISKFLVSEKLDGVRAYWNGKNLITRGGHYINAPMWFTQDFPKIALDGELWLGRNKFEKLSGIVRKQVPVDSEWYLVKYVVFDMPQDLSIFENRYQNLRLLKKMNNSRYLTFVKQMKISSKAILDEHLALVVAKGGEGLMLHRKDSLYQARRSSDLQKLKPFDDEEAKVIAHIEGKGKYKNMLGAIEVINKDGIRFKIGSGFSVKERLSPPPINSEITYRFRGKTNKNTPRFATYLRMKELP